MKKVLKHVGRALGIVLLALVLVVGGYVLYMQLNYYRIEDHQALDVEQPNPAELALGQEYTAVTYNIGFGAYGPEYSFFMDVGGMKDGTVTQGLFGKAISEESVLAHTNGAMDVLRELDADFCLLQEVDESADRSYNVNQRQMIAEGLSAYSRVWANNFHSAYLFYPLNDPHGAVQAGLDTLSRYKVASAERRSYPVDDSFIVKFTDLDRCFAVLRLPVAGTDKELVLINSHMSAYDAGGTIRAQQVQLLCDVVQSEYAQGNYVIVGGDFNHALYGSALAFPNEQVYPDWVQEMSDADLPEHFHFVVPENGLEVPTCRGADIPYEPGVTYVTCVDGFFVSDNVRVTAENIDTAFANSDHNPVKITFELME